MTLFGFLYWQTAGYLKSGTDEWLAREIRSLVTASPSQLIEHLQEHAAHDPEANRPFALFDAAGNKVEGNLANLPTSSLPADRPFEFSLNRGGDAVPFRGLARRLPSGDMVVVSQNVREMHEFRELLVGAMAWGGLLVLIMGLAGAASIGAGSVRRIDEVTGAIERIVKGNLAGRLPTHGTAGDLDRLVDVVNGMLDDIERLMHEVKGVSDGIAHDLRTPLTRLLAGLERAGRRAASVEEYAVAVDEAIVETKAVLSTFGAMLRISEVEDGARRTGFTTLDLAALVADVTEFYEPLAESKGVSFSLKDESAGSAKMAGDPSLLFEAIGNLVDNAIKFTPSGGRITVRVFNENKHFGIIVADTGPGIPAEEREAVLRRFYRAERSRHTPGSGLGLSLVAAVARLHGLDLIIEDAKPGCSVTLRGENNSTWPHLAAAERSGISGGGR
ncbi:ATP-binding protein [Bradyrhizobium sp. 197]|uniref:ATP-binding protein n=1 Tax=Bradyrhizobium sp. 197 TaxID=2782663 RepID=UPI001FF90365|nr:ATP-binding protein [Bradyrhizobium sp. 197]